jgi:hypothetical protein
MGFYAEIAEQSALRHQPGAKGRYMYGGAART